MVLVVSRIRRRWRIATLAGGLTFRMTIATGTETAAERYGDVETWNGPDVLSAIVDGQVAAIEAIRPAIPSIAAAAELMAATWRTGKRVAYAGAGSSGLVALLDALELPGTYGLSPADVPVFLAGGGATLTALDNGAEDDEAEAEAAVASIEIGEGDLLVGVSASGSTRYTLAAARAAKARGARVVGIACNVSAPLLYLADVAIAVPTGAEIVSGSTRMNAGTAQKAVFNMLSTLAAMKLHHVYAGMMVNVRAENAKLRERAVRIVVRASGAGEPAARAALSATDGAVKPAVLVARGTSPEEAARLLDVTGGDLRLALARLD